MRNRTSPSIWNDNCTHSRSELADGDSPEPHFHRLKADSWRRGMSETNDSPPPDPADNVNSASKTQAADRKRRRSWHWIAWPGVLLLACLAAALFWRRHEAGQSQPPRTPPPIPVVVAQAEQGDIGACDRISTVTPLNTITVTTRGRPAHGRQIQGRRKGSPGRSAG